MGRVLFLILALLAYGSLFPWHFEFSSAAGNPLWVVWRGWPAEWTRYILRDVVLNIVIYTPFGFAAALVFRRRHSRRFAAAAAIACGFLFSLSMEVLQVYIPLRDPSSADVLTNTVGSAAGAAVALYFEERLRRLGERRHRRFRSAALLLLALWAVVELYPFFPQIGRTHLEQGLDLLLHTRSVSPIEIWANCAEWFAIGLVLDAIFTHMRTAWLALAMVCVPAQLAIASRLLTVPEIAGALLALALWHFVGAESRPRWCAWLLASAILLGQLEPFYFLAVPQPFSWIPFQAALLSNRALAPAILIRKAFDYGALVWALRYTGLRFIWAGLAVAAALAATEAIQTYLPGRTPEITDPVLALLMMLILRVVGRSATKAV